MDAFQVLNSAATSTFSTVVGFPFASTTAYATSSILRAFIAAPLDFLYQNHAGIIAYGMIALVILTAASAFRFYQH